MSGKWLRYEKKGGGCVLPQMPINILRCGKVGSKFKLDFDVEIGAIGLSMSKNINRH